MIRKIKNYQAPELGEMKIKKRFAFLPKRIGDKIITFGWYEELYIYGNTAVLVDDGNVQYFKSWVKTSTRIR